MSTYLLGLFGAALTVAFVVTLLRRGILRERFAALWLLVSLLLLIGAIFPSLLRAVSEAVGFEVPANFLFFLSIIFLLLVSVQLSFEVSRVEARTRRLAEELAILTAEVRARRDPRAQTEDPRAPTSTEHERR